MTAVLGEATEHLDVLIVGAGLSGIGAAWHLQDRCPGKSYAILEAREDLGGTWDLFRYPGIRSDSDMHTLGYRFKPWTGSESISDGPSILEYLRETARENGIAEKIRFRQRVVAAEWSSDEARWTVEVEHTESGEKARLTCDFLWTCSGYYRYDEGFTPRFEGEESFNGTVVHPQKWPEGLDYTGKRVVVIGSGATAVTLVPALAEQAAHVTMVQRSPTYIVSLPTEDRMAELLRRVLPSRLANWLVRWKFILFQTLVYQFSRHWPDRAKRLIRRGVERSLPAGYDVDKHFAPRYDPWDQRMCLVPDGDLFEAISSGSASIVTDTIAGFTENGIALESGEEIEADMIVTATGLNLLFLGGMQLVTDGEPVDLAKTMIYRGMMLSGVPNFAFTFGYSNASWTLKADLISEYTCRLLNHMDANGYRSCVPEVGPSVTEQPFVDLTAGYVLRSIDSLPKQGSEEPWKLRQNYIRDVRTIRHSRIEDGVLYFANGARPRGAAGEPDRDTVAARS